MLTSFATVISTVSGLETFRKPAGIMGTLRRAALTTAPALNVSCLAVDVDVRMRFQPSRGHGLMVNYFTLTKEEENIMILS